MGALARSAWRIGLDLDNTLVTYDALFSEVAKRFDLLSADFSGGKRDVREAVRNLPGGELGWQRVQAYVYGPGMLDAEPAPGVRRFIERAVQENIDIVIVSHKTEFAAGDPAGANLRDVARKWLLGNGIVGANAIPPSGVYFESTREEKIARITALRCTHFVDDLEEVFDDPAFPAGVERMLIAQTAVVPKASYRCFASFDEIADEIFRG